jgi:hypothetical protein
LTGTDPYRAPDAALVDTPNAPSFAVLYSPAQVGWGSFFGGPFATVYLVHANFVALGRRAAAGRTLLNGVPMALLLLGLIMFLPGNRVATPLYALLGFAANQFVKERQLRHDAIATAPHLDFHSNWRVVAVIVVGLLAVFALSMAGLYVLESLGYGDLVPE